jgi:GT2 family glycosyltransferase
MASFMWSRDLVRKIGYFNIEYSCLCEDYDYEIRTFLETDKIIHISKYLIEYYTGNDTQTHKNLKRMKETHEKIKIKYQTIISQMKL